jgi:hypothetical protein
MVGSKVMFVNLKLYIRKKIKLKTASLIFLALGRVISPINTPNGSFHGACWFSSVVYLNQCDLCVYISSAKY